MTDIPEKTVRDQMQQAKRNYWGWGNNNDDKPRLWLRQNVHQPLNLAAQHFSKKLLEYLIKEGADSKNIITLNYFFNKLKFILKTVNWIGNNNRTILDNISTQVESYENQIKNFGYNDQISKILTKMKKFKEDTL